jgi:spectinomycin phosphotransferase
MLEKPDIPNETISAFLKSEYGLPVSEVTFLPLGADQNTAVFRAESGDGNSSFVKLRRGAFNQSSVTFPHFLSNIGITQVITPLVTRKGRLWAGLEDFTLILYPYITGKNGYEQELRESHWIDFGKTLKRIHTALVPFALIKDIPQETFPTRERDFVKSLLNRPERDTYPDPVAAEVAGLLKTKRAEIFDLIGRAETLSRQLRSSSLDLIVCHSDLHAGNILIDAKDQLYILDWDDPILASKERDLMYIGGGQFGNRRTPKEEETLFYQGYGPTQINTVALAYYRYERMIQDISAYCQQLLLSTEGGEDREQSLGYLQSIFLPGNTIEIAYQADKTQNAVGYNRPDV